MKNNYPKLHNAAWPGVVGKGLDSEPPISLDTLLDLTAAAEVDGVKFDGIRPNGVVRIDSATDPTSWASDPGGNTKLIAQTWRKVCDVAADYGEDLAEEGEICWGGMHSWKAMVRTLEAVDRPNISFQADMAHTLLYLLG